MGWFSRTAKTDPADAIRGLRQQALTVDAAALNLTPTPERPHVWGVLMETGYQGAAASLVVFADGTTSLYFSNGGGVIGAGQHASVREAAGTLLSVADSQFARFAPAPDTALPAVGRVRFVIRTFTGTLGAEAAETDLASRAHPLAAVFFAAQRVITAIREATPAP